MNVGLSSQFVALELIGRGSFGSVWKVERKTDGKWFVRKEVSYMKMNAKEISQVIAEFRILSELSHPNIVKYLHHEHISENKTVNLYMEYCDGGDLSKLIRTHRRNKEYISEEKIWSIFTQVLLALYRCHYGTDFTASKEFESLNKGNRRTQNPSWVDSTRVIIHRDIKPDNIFLMNNSNLVKLGDFGLAKMLDQENDFAKTYVGTPYYMSPEVLLDQPYSPLCDIWSLGCVMYELCALRPPFQATTHLQLQQKIQEGIFPPLPDVFSPRLRSLINACVTIDLNKRPSTHELLQESCFNVYIKEVNLEIREDRLNERERKLKIRENKLILSEEGIVKQLNEELEFQRKLLEQEVEEIRKSYKNEFQFVLEQQVQQALSKILGPQYNQKPLNRNQQQKQIQQIYSRQDPQLSSPKSQQAQIQGPRELLKRGANIDRNNLRRPLGLIDEEQQQYNRYR
ncbi:hypothetical protein LJB42_001946 [Komagataella kurtzmanii]|nr:hypothetical protein LJB42_001946 [Komagataella kurtzmanii]